MAVAVPTLKAPRGKSKRAGRVRRRGLWWRLFWRLFAPYAVLIYLLSTIYLLGNGLQATGDSLLADQKDQVNALQRALEAAQAEIDALKAPWRVAQFARMNQMEVVPRVPLAAGVPSGKTSIARLP